MSIYVGFSVWFVSVFLKVSRMLVMVNGLIGFKYCTQTREGSVPHAELRMACCTSRGALGPLRIEVILKL